MYLNPYNWSSWNNPTSALLDTMVSQSIQRSILEKTIQNQSGTVPEAGAPAPASAAAARLPIAITDFEGGSRGDAAARLAASLDGLGAKEREQFEAMFVQGMAAVEADPGFRKNNLANAVTFLILASLMAVKEREESDADQDALLAAVNDMLGSNEAFQQIAAKDKQQLYESCLATGTLVAGLYSAASEAKNEAVKQQAKALGRATLAQLGVTI